jgi:hypothetical protein
MIVLGDFTTESITLLKLRQIQTKSATVRRLILLKSIVPKPIVPKVMTKEDVAATADVTTADAVATITTDMATTDASAPALLETETYQEQTSPIICASGVAYPDRDPTVPLVWLVLPVKK